MCQIVCEESREEQHVNFLVFCPGVRIHRGHDVDGHAFLEHVACAAVFGQRALTNMADGLRWNFIDYLHIPCNIQYMTARI